MKRKNSHAWTPERRKRQLATLAAKRERNGQPINGVIDLNHNVETGRMEQALLLVRGLSDPGRAYVIARLEEDDL